MPAPGLRVAGSVVFLFFTTYGWICCLPILHCMRKRDCASSWSMCGWICWLPFFHYIWLDLSTSYFALQVEEGLCQLLAYVWLVLSASYSSTHMAGFVAFLFCTAGGRGTVPAPGLCVAGSVGFLFFTTYGWICWLPFLHHIWLDLLASYSSPHMAGSAGFLFCTAGGRGTVPALGLRVAGSRARKAWQGCNAPAPSVLLFVPDPDGECFATPPPPFSSVCN